MRPAKIFMVIRLLNGRVGGAERLFIDTANLFAEEGGYDVTCLYCDSRKAKPFYPVSPKVSLINLYGRTARRAPWYRAVDWVGKRYADLEALAPADWLSKNLYFTRRLAAAFASGRPDVAISFLPPANTPTLVAGKLTGTKVIPTNHNVPEKDFADPVRWDQNPVDKKLRLHALRWAARVHVIFPTFAEWFPDDIREKIVPIANYVSPEFDDIEMPETRENVIVAAGRLAAVKNYGVLVDAWARVAERHPDWQVRIYGGGPHAGRLSGAIAAHGLEDRVRLMGHESDMRSAMLAGQIFAHPALHEGFGLSVAEALCCGLPVVAFADCDGTNEFVLNEVNGLMVERPLGAEGYAAALSRLIEDEELRARLSAAAPGSVAQYSRAAFLERWSELIEQVRSEP